MDYFKEIHRLFVYVEEQGLKPGYDLGLLLISKNGQLQQYIFLDVELGGKNPGDIPHLLTLPPAKYRFLRVTESSIAKAPELFPDLFAQPYDKIIMEVESFLEVSTASAPVFELRCSLPSQPE